MSARRRSAIVARAVLVAIGVCITLAVVVMIARSTPAGTASIRAVQAESDSAALTVSVAHSDCGVVPNVEVAETSTRVELSVAYRPNSTCVDIAKTTVDAVVLARPLGDRQILASDSLADLRCVVDGSPSARCSSSP